jgi:hypothetical protein
MMVKVSYIFLVIALLALCGCSEKESEKSNTSSGGPNPSPSPHPNPNEALGTSKPAELPAEVVQDAWTKFENNPALPESNLKNKTLETTGKVVNIEKMAAGLNQGKWVLTMVSETNAKKGLTRCLFERAEDLESTAKGKVARVQGRFDSWKKDKDKDQHCLYLRDCVLK